MVDPASCSDLAIEHEIILTDAVAHINDETIRKSESQRYGRGDCCKRYKHSGQWPDCEIAFGKSIRTKIHSLP